MMAMESVQLEVRVPRPVGAEASLPKRSSLTTERRRSFTMESLDATSLPWHQVDMAELSSEDGSSCGASPASFRSESPEMTRAMAMGVPLKHSFALGVKVIVANSLKDGTQVSILNQGLNDDNAEAIVELLKQKRVTKLLLANNALGDASAIKIAQELKTNKTLTMLSLHSNRIGCRGGLAFAEALAVNATLKSLFLSGNSISPEVEARIMQANEARPKPMSGLGGLVLGWSR